MNQLDQLVIEHACEKLCRRFANYGDQNEFRALVELFTEDGIYVRPSVPDQEITGRETLYQEFLKRPPLVIKHLVSNCVIDVISPTEATGFSYIIYLASPLSNSDEPLPLTAGPAYIGEFRDKYVLMDNGWKFEERRGSLSLKT